MISVNNVTVSGKVVEYPKRFLLEETNTVMVVFKIHNETFINNQRKTSYTITIKCFGNVAEFVDAVITNGDEVIVSGTIACHNQLFRGGFVGMPYIRALAVSKLEQEQYK